MQTSEAMNQDHPQKDDNNNNSEARPGTPPCPPYSPVTPVLSQLAPVPGLTPIVPPPGPTPDAATNLASYTSPSPTSQYYPPHPQPSSPIFMPQPAPIPISESENPDAIALRSTLSILQLQKQQSIRDIQKLDRMKEAAAADPEGFAKELAAGNLTAREKGGFIEFSDEGDDSVEDKASGESERKSRFGKIPNPQNVVRMPPVNWAKYQIVGESLNKIHDEQLRRPALGEPRREGPSQRAPEHLLASPYRPLVDKLETPVKGKSTNKGRKA